MYADGFPTALFNLIDGSGAQTQVLTSVTTPGLHLPFSFVMAERGEPGKIRFGGGAEHVAFFGSETFNESSKYFNPANRFAGVAMNNGSCQMRLVDPAATTATLGLFAKVTPKKITQYEKDVLGNRKIDNNGDWIPLKDSNDAPIQQDGLSILFTVRQLTGSEKYNGLVPVTTNTGGVDVVTYPILAWEVNSQGSYGQRQGLRLSVSKADTKDTAETLQSILYRFTPIELPTGVSVTGQPIVDNFGAKYNDISFRDIAVFAPTNTNYALKYVTKNAYVDATTGINKLPYKLFGYGANVKTIGERLIALSPELVGTDPYLIDIVTGTDTDSQHYDHLAIESASSTVVGDAVTNYAKGGSDGDTSFAKLQELIRDWLVGNDHGEFGNTLQFPITHFYDPGFTMETKYLVLTLLGLRDDIKVDLSTQDAAMAPNTEAQDVSAAQALLFRAQMYPESVVNGVPCARVGIYAHTGELLVGTPYSEQTPFTLNRLLSRMRLAGGQRIEGSVGGQPESLVSAFKSVNWVADANPSRKRAWTSGFNAVMHADMIRLFYPSIRTVYTNDTSLLIDDEVSDIVCCYLKKVCRQVWAIYVGRRQSSEKMFPLISSDMDQRCSAFLNGDDLQITTELFRTAADTNLGYKTSVRLLISGSLAQRQMEFIFDLERAVAQ